MTLEQRFRLIFSINLKESLRELFENLFKTGASAFTKNFAKLFCGEPIIDKIGLKGQSFLCILGRPYSFGRCEPTGLIKLYVV